MKNVNLPNLCGVPKFVLLWFVGNTTSLDHQLCVKTIYQTRDKEIVEVPWCSNL